MSTDSIRRPIMTLSVTRVMAEGTQSKRNRIGPSIPNHVGNKKINKLARALVVQKIRELYELIIHVTNIVQ